MIIKSIDDLECEITQEQISEFIQDWAKKQLASRTFRGALADEFQEIESQDKRVTDLVMDPKSYAALRKGIGPHQLDTVSQKNLLETGLVALLWGAKIWISCDCNPNEIRLFAEDDVQLSIDFPAIASAKSIS